VLRQDGVAGFTRVQHRSSTHVRLCHLSGCSDKSAKEKVRTFNHGFFQFRVPLTLDLLFKKKPKNIFPSGKLFFKDEHFML
jgi:hypothetical protein